MSAPVLSRLFTAQGKAAKDYRSNPVKTRHSKNPLFTLRRPAASAQLIYQEKDPHAQPSEPILFPKLRIYFADFPYLLYSIDQRLLTLET